MLPWPRGLPNGPEWPAGCRECGAPLEVPADALVARCVYCGADSAVVIRTPFLARARRAARAVAHTLDEAVALDTRERAGTRRSMGHELGRYLLVTGIFGGLFATFMWDDARVTALDDGSAPALGITAIVIGTLLLIVLMLRSVGSGDRAKDEARARRADHGLPGWVRIVGPFGFWALLWLIRIAIWR